MTKFSKAPRGKNCFQLSAKLFFGFAPKIVFGPQAFYWGVAVLESQKFGAPLSWFYE